MLTTFLHRDTNTVAPGAPGSSNSTTAPNGGTGSASGNGTTNGTAPHSAGISISSSGTVWNYFVTAVVATGFAGFL
jgi:hypothetical protein